MVALSQRCLHNSTYLCLNKRHPRLPLCPFRQKSASLALCAWHKTTQEQVQRPRRSNSESPQDQSVQSKVSSTPTPTPTTTPTPTISRDNNCTPSIQSNDCYRNDPIPITLIISSLVFGRAIGSLQDLSRPSAGPTRGTLNGLGKHQFFLVF